MARRPALLCLLCALLSLWGIPLFAQEEGAIHWETPSVFSSRNGSFPVSAYRDDLAAVVWQETTPNAGTAAGGAISVSLAVRERGGAWQLRENIGSYEYSGDEPSILSVTIDDEARILVAVAASAGETDLLVSADRGISFEHHPIQMGSESAVAPRIFTRADGGYLLFITRGGRGQTLLLYYARSDDAVTWSAFAPFAGDNASSFLPAHTGMGTRDYVVYQGQVMTAGQISTYQLFMRSSDNGGRTWSSTQRITSFIDQNREQSRPEMYDNQRPHLSVLGRPAENSREQTQRIFLVWERRYNNEAPQIFGMKLQANLQADGRAERINSEEAYCNNPIGFELNGSPTAVWFDNSLGNQQRIILSRQGVMGWERGIDISGGVGGEAAFARPVIAGDNIYIFWQAGTRIYALAPDTIVAMPRLFARNFTLGRRSSNELVQIGWNPPRGAASVLGYAWSWSKDANAEPPREIMGYSSQQTSEQIADSDGTWYFALITQDITGAWTNPVRLGYIRDRTPPPAARILPPETDENGFLLSNTFSLRWNTPPASDISGYTWNLEYLGSSGQIALSGEELNAAAETLFGSRIARPPQSIQGRGTSAEFDNEDNGLFCFSVQAVDEVGNIGAASRYYFKTNKYRPRTYVSYINAFQNEQGYIELDILGRGFAEGGAVTRIVLDKDGSEPWDYEFLAGNNDYRVRSDREIAELVVEGLDEGVYHIIMDHPARGRYISPPLLSIDKNGMIKFGDFSREWQPSWKLHQNNKFVIDTPFLILVSVLVFCSLLLLATARGLSNVVAESHAIRLETIALLTGDIMPSEKKKRLTKIKRRGAGLAFKMASFTIALVILVVGMISTPLYVMMMRTQEGTLLKGLWDRSSVLLEGIDASARAYMPGNNFLELGYLPAQSSAIPEAHYVTITGYGTSGDVFYNHVLATNDPDIHSKIDTADLDVGNSRLTDNLSPRTQGIADELDMRAREQIGEISATIASLTREATVLIESNNPDQVRIDEIAATTRSLRNRVTEALADISREIGSEPAFSTTSLRENRASDYIFFKPVLYRSSEDDSYYRGLVRLEVGIDSIVDQIRAGQIELLRVILIIALAAIAMGALGALLLSTVIIRPITRLVSHVERIRDTEDKTKLQGVDIEIKSSDEIAVLGNTINDMTHGLVKAAAAAADLSLGKEIQKKFIPLELDHDGNKLTSGYKDFKNVQFFGYYEGAKGVSGDYFDYQDLDGRYFAVIKCDVAGKGIPAALIMIQVATMFISFFRRWKPDEKGLHIEDLVYQINDFLETLGFKGRFAAFTLALFDSQTGIVRFCNAGDNIVHFFDASKTCMQTVTLKETPATGVLPNFLVESKGGYRVQTLTLDKGDILFLYTDGIEEAKRKFRNSEFKEILCEEGETDTPHATHTVGQGDEEMGPDRVEGIINAVMTKQLYTLHKYHNPEGENHDLGFDFTSCAGSVEEAVLAMVSVEKVFRMYRDPNAGEDARVLVDKRVDEFLKKHFLQYRTYCYEKRESPGNDAYLYYTHVREDDQYDDLTILGINRK
ncbi:MAG: SpoIIE family protein phosphatase [Treponema sp.]|jgi:serine phosphatase RsbU (regulator of sigma subunit)|nr:SpoIIE family protein phosphatase [Treponema sp.]